MAQRVQVRLKDTADNRAAFPKDKGTWFTVIRFSRDGFVYLAREDAPKCGGMWNPSYFDWNNVRLEAKKGRAKK